MILPVVWYHKLLSCCFNNTTLRKADLWNCIFSNCEIEQSDFTRTNFHSIVLENCKLSDSDFQASSLTSCKLINTIFRNCNLKLLDIDSSQIWKNDKYYTIKDPNDFYFTFSSNFLLMLENCKCWRFYCNRLRYIDHLSNLRH